MSEPLPLTRLHRDLNFASVGALVALLWDWVITLDNEVELIWSKSNRSWLKWMFLFTRYYILACAITARSLEVAVVYSLPLDWTCVRVWYICEVLVASHAMSALEILLMMRVYALYNRPRWMAILFGVLLFLENAIVVVGIVVNLPDDSFRPIEIVASLPPSFSYFGFSNMAVQVVIMYLTIRKYRKDNFKAIPIVKLIFRDGTVAFCILSAMALLMSAHAIFEIEFATAPYPWLLVAISAVTTRMIINMQKLPTRNGVPFEQGSTNIQFTSIVNTRYWRERTTTCHRTTAAQTSGQISMPTHAMSSSPYESIP